MLVEPYPTDKRFEELLSSMPELAPALKKRDEDLEDGNLSKLIRADLVKRYPKTKVRGRKSTPVDVVLRMRVVKRL
jgi:transposase, IS5 family